MNPFRVIAQISDENIDRYASIATYFLISVTVVYWLIPARELTKTITLFAVFLALMPLRML